VTGKKAGVDRRSKLLHEGFELGIVLKGIHSLLEIAGGLLLLLVPPSALSQIIRVLTQNELSEDPHDLLANLMVQASLHYSMSTRSFGVIYLLSHGAIKIVLVFLLWKKILWAYPLGIAALVLFIVYQLARWTGSHSIFLLLLSLLDAFMIWLTLVEYRRLRGAKSA